MENNQSGLLNTVCIGLEGFQDIHYKRFVCKEFCLVDCDSIYVYHKLIKTEKSVYDSFEPMDLLKFKHSETFYHGLDLYSGDIELSKLIQQIYPKIAGKKVIVYYPHQVRCMNQLFNESGPIDCEVLDSEHDRTKIYPNDENPIGICHYHKATLGAYNSCAHRDAQDLRTFVIERSRINSSSISM